MEGSPLKKLPPELRNRIYELALHQPEGMHAQIEDSKPKFKNPPPGFAITATCKQIRSEAFPMFYGINEFTIYTRHFAALNASTLETWTAPCTYDEALQWLETLDDTALEHLQSVTLDLGSWTTDNSTRGKWRPDLMNGGPFSPRSGRFVNAMRRARTTWTQPENFQGRLMPLHKVHSSLTICAYRSRSGWYNPEDMYKVVEVDYSFPRHSVMEAESSLEDCLANVKKGMTETQRDGDALKALEAIHEAVCCAVLEVPTW